MSTKTVQVAEFKHKIASDDRWAIRAMLRIYQFQTADEQQSGHTRLLNGMGFNGRDAEIMTDFVKKLRHYGSLTPRQRAVVRKVMPKYAGQLVRFVESHEASPKAVELVVSNEADFS